MVDGWRRARVCCEAHGPLSCSSNDTSGEGRPAGTEGTAHAPKNAVHPTSGRLVYPEEGSTVQPYRLLTTQAPRYTEADGCVLLQVATHRYVGLVGDRVDLWQLQEELG